MKNTSQLENRFKDFIVNNGKGICIDDDDSKFKRYNGQNKKKADYLINDNKFILEIKSLFEDRSQRINDKLNELVTTDKWLSHNWKGTIHIEDLICKHPDSKNFRRRIMDYAYDNIKTKVVHTANKQIRDTKEVLNLQNSSGGIILLNEHVHSHDADYLSNEILYLLETQKYPHVEFVIYISSVIDKLVNFYIIIDSKSKNKDFIYWYFNNVFLLNWASFNGYALSCWQPVAI